MGGVGGGGGGGGGSVDLGSLRRVKGLRWEWRSFNNGDDCLFQNCFDKTCFIILISMHFIYIILIMVSKWGGESFFNFKLIVHFVKVFLHISITPHMIKPEFHLDRTCKILQDFS